MSMCAGRANAIRCPLAPGTPVGAVLGDVGIPATSGKVAEALRKIADAITERPRARAIWG
jgi:hypothetical protein